MSHQYTRSGGHGRFFKLTLLTILILVITTLATGSSQPTAAQGVPGPAWIFQGPAPQVNAQQDLANVAQPDEPVSGAVAAIAASPTDPNLVYIGAANGGVWKTTNATDPNPTWTPLTDQLQSLSIGIDALALDPLDATGQTVIAGTGRFSGYANRGDDLVGLYYTTDGGATWTTTTDPQLSAARITGVAARGSTLLAASENGLFRSTSGPLGTWTKISGSGGLPDARAADITADPSDNNRFYVTFTGASGGLFRTDDLGANWTDVTGGLSAAISAGTDAFEVAVYNDGVTSAVTVVLNGINGDPEVNAIFRSVDGGAFTALDVPFVFMDAYGKFGLVADKTNPDLVYVSGGYALIGSNPFLATTHRVDASQPSGSQLTLLFDAVSTDTVVAISATTGYAYIRKSTILPTTLPFDIIIDEEQVTVNSIYSDNGWYYIFRVTRGVNGTTAAAHALYAPVFPLDSTYGAPHVDINNLATDANGSLLMGAHGGIFNLPNPASSSAAANTWLSKNGNLGVTEMHDIAYDHVTSTLIGSNQDNCVVVQSASGSLIWPVGSGWSGDGGDVAVADIGGGQSIRYGANQSLGMFQRQVFDAANNLVSATTLSTSIITDKQFTTPIAVNAVDPDRLLIAGSANLYESTNRGDTINKIAAVGIPLGSSSRTIDYGGRRNGVANPDVLYVADKTTLYTRTTADGLVVSKPFLAGGASSPTDLVMNPSDWMNVFVVDENQVFASTNGGDTWLDVTGNLFSVSSTQIMTVEFVEAPAPYIVVGTRSGVFASNLGSLGSWFELGQDLPDVLVYELDYDAVDDVLAAATLGRGAWLLPDASSALVVPSVAPVLSMSGPTTADEGTTQYTYSFTVNDPGDSFTLNGPTITGGALVTESLVKTGSGGSFKITFSDGPATATIDLQVTDSSGLTSNTASTSVTVANIKPTVALLGAPTSGSPGTPINLTMSVTDPSPTDTAAGFTYEWLVQKYVNNVFVGNFASGNAVNFSYTPDVIGSYKVYYRATDKDGAIAGWYVKTITAASPDLTLDALSVTVSESMAATNSGTFANVNGNPLTLTASVGTLARTDNQTSSPLNVRGYWKLGEDDPGAADGLPGNDPTLGRNASGLNTSLDLTRQGGPLYTSSVDPNHGSTLAMSFNGSTDGYSLSHPVITAINNFGMEAWVKFNSFCNCSFVQNGTITNGFGLGVTSSGQLYGYNGSQILGTSVVATPGVWYHVAFVRGGGTSRVYINGVQTGSTSTSFPSSITGTFSIGRDPNYNRFFDGTLDSVRVFTFAAGTFDPQDLLINPPSVSGTWSWSYVPDDGPAQSQDVTITATDDVNGEVTNLSFPLVVENLPPTATFSNGGAVSEDSTGVVSFSDQADPSAADTSAGFHYAYDFDNDGNFELGNGTYGGSVTDASATVPASYLAEPGSRTVLGRILDKDNGYTDYTTDITINDEPPMASISGPADALVGQVIPFVVGMTHLSAADEAADFVYSIDWGDGSSESVDPVVGIGEEVVRHVYAGTGSYNIQVTATDQNGVVSALPGSAAIAISALNIGSLQALLATAPFVELAPASNAAFQSEVAAVNGLTDPGTPIAITIILGAGPYTPVTLSPADNIILDLAGNDTKDSDGTQIISSNGPAVTVAAGEVYVQGDHLATSADAPTVLVTGGHLTLDQVNIQESDGFNNVAVKVAGGSVNLGFDVIMNVNGDGGFVDSYVRSALVPHPEGIDAELTPNTFQVTQYADDGTLIQATIKAVSLSSTSLTSSAATTTFGEAVTFTAAIDVNAREHGLATGTVNFYDGATLLGDGMVTYFAGQFVASFTTDALSVGEHTIMAVYGGDEAYVASSATLAHQVLEPANEAPVAVNDAYNTYAGAALTIAAPGVLGNDTDADGDQLLAIKVSDPLHGSLTLNADGSFTYTPAAGWVGTDSFTYKANDGTADSNVATVSIAVQYSFTGFFSPVDNPPVLNQAKAGSSIPIKFSLAGDQGLSILAAGYPVSIRVACESSAPVDNVEELATSNSGLSYNPAIDQYNYVWKTQKSWAGTCRQFTLRLADGTNHVALFKFK